MECGERRRSGDSQIEADYPESGTTSRKATLGDSRNDLCNYFVNNYLQYVEFVWHLNCS
jgi:hypothetical protein